MRQVLDSVKGPVPWEERILLGCWNVCTPPRSHRYLPFFFERRSQIQDARLTQNTGHIHHHRTTSPPHVSPLAHFLVALLLSALSRRHPQPRLQPALCRALWCLWPALPATRARRPLHGRRRARHDVDRQPRQLDAVAAGPEPGPRQSPRQRQGGPGLGAGAGRRHHGRPEAVPRGVRAVGGRAGREAREAAAGTRGLRQERLGRRVGGGQVHAAVGGAAGRQEVLKEAGYVTRRNEAQDPIRAFLTRWRTLLCTTKYTIDFTLHIP